jgi:hypothetical protein
MPSHANDNVKVRTNKGCTIEPFHRQCTSGRLHKSKAMNQQLYYVGLQYRKSYHDAGGTSLSQPPAYEKPVQRDSYSGYSEVRNLVVDKCLPYHEAAKVLDALEIREVVEAIVVHGRPLIGVGKEYSGRNQVQQARSAAITAMGIGLIALRNHYGELKMEMAA